MNCIFCNNDPCVCGQAYNDLSDDIFLNMLLAIQSSDKGKKLGLNINVGDTPLKSYMSLLDVNVKTVVGYIDKVKDSTDISNKYIQYLEDNAGKSLVELVGKITNDANLLKFPLVAYLYLTSEETDKKLTSRNLASIIIDYIIDPDIHAQSVTPIADDKLIEDAEENWNKSVNSFISHLSYVIGDPRFESIKEPYLARYMHACLQYLSMIGESKKRFFESAISFMADAYMEYRSIISLYNKNKDITNALVDELYSADAAFTARLIAGNQFRSSIQI